MRKTSPVKKVMKEEPVDRQQTSLAPAISKFKSSQDSILEPGIEAKQESNMVIEGKNT